VVPHLDRVGGYERQALTLAQHQQRGGKVAPILLTHRDDTELPATEVGLYGEIHRLDKGLLRHQPSSWWRRARDSVQFVHAHALHKLSGQLLALAYGAGVPSIVKVATGDDVAMFSNPKGWEGLLDDEQLDSGRGLRWRMMMNAAWRRLRLASTFISLNSSIAEQLSQQGLASVRLPNGVDVDHFRPVDEAGRQAAREDLGIPHGGCCIVYVGRVAPRKDTPVLVRAFLRLLARGDRSSHLVIAGEGQDLPLLRQLFEDAGQVQRVTFLGVLEDVRPVLAAADVFVHPSRREGMPNSVLEALASGLAVVLSDIDAHHTMLEGRPAALTYPVGDEAALAARLAGLVPSPERRRVLARAARELVLERFTIQSVAAAYEQLYAQLGKTHPLAGDSAR
jgi:glycosyltransferase involved in cell wall biosynthesis